MLINNKENRVWFILFCLLVFANKIVAQTTTDSDGDGVMNTIDLCPNTPVGTVVNPYGCPTNLSSCDYTTDNFSLNVVGSASTETQYLLVNSSTGLIEQISITPSFSSLSGTQTYMVLAYSYIGTATGLVVGNQLNTVSSTCQDWSNALVVKVCVPSALPTLTINDVSVNENSGTATLTITSSSTSTSVISVNYATSNNTAVSGSDYIVTNSTATIPVGSTSVTITIPIIDDSINESIESFNVNLSNANNATIADSQGVVTINDNDALLLAILAVPSSISVNENVGTATITVTLSSASTSNVTVNYATANGSAISGSDFTSSSGSLTFLAGETSKTIIVPINDDNAIEGNEAFTVTLSGATGATLGSSSQTTVTITDNDVAGTTDSDGDGVVNSVDLCPNTPAGTSVNAYGCPTNLNNCDYNASSFTLNSTTPPTGKETRYVLADAADGKIIQISNTPSFSGLTGTKTYMVLAFSYENDNTLVNMTTNNYLNQVSAACSDWSNALVVKVCSPFIGGNTCDFTSSVVTLSSGVAPAGATTKYVLVNSNGMITQVSSTPTFTGLSGTNNYNAYSISYLNSITNLNVGSNISDVSGTCFDWSSPLSIKVCVCPPSICLPIQVTRIK